MAQDAYGFSLHYYANDYKGLGYGAGNTILKNGSMLYNGNIAAMAVNIPVLGAPLVYGYKYDQLNRLTRMDAFTGLHIAKGTYNPVQLPEYKERVSYDANGNIKTYIRNGDKARLNMDSLLYIYQPNNNQLTQVLDYMPDNNAYNDIKSRQAANNYSYDAIGNLISDQQEGISAIKWNVYGKIASINKTTGAINYKYDASGNRVMKQTPTDTVAYVRDASGNVLSVYTKNKNSLVQQSETYLYGSSRLGVVREQRVAPKTMKLNASFNDAKLGVFTRGEKMYELSNHLGNVLTTVSDKRLPVTKSNDTVVSGYKAVVVNASDYYPFGMEMVGRNVNANTYRYGASSGQEKSTEINTNSYTAEYWQYDSRIGRRWNVDPVVKEFESGYAAYGNNPIWFMDPNGLDTVKSRSGANPGDVYNFNGKWLYMGEKGGWWDGDGTAYSWAKKNKNNSSFFASPDNSDQFMRIKSDNAWELYKKSGEKRVFKTSLRGIQTIIDWESYYKNIYNDDVGNATIGYGSLLHLGNYTSEDGAKYPNGISREKAFIMLLNELEVKERNVTYALETHKIKLTQGQWDATMAFVYNLGEGKITNGLTTKGAMSSFVKALISDSNNGSIMSAAFMKYTWAKDEQTGKRVQLRGLVRRRKKEADIFVNGIYNTIH